MKSLKPMAVVALIMIGGIVFVGCSSAPAPTLAPTTAPISVPGINQPAGATSTPQTLPATKEPYPAPGQGMTVTPEAYPAPADGETLINQRCADCHNLDRVRTAKKSEEAWRTTVERMIQKGARLSPEEKEVVIKYLAENFK